MLKVTEDIYIPSQGMFSFDSIKVCQNPFSGVVGFHSSLRAHELNENSGKICLSLDLVVDARMSEY